ncbi:MULTISPECIES: hypothetical protein [unclassified Methylophilus]|uniref:hypothetical protein n=1 Tax=unclassified Methylophilus TaxID=2630143 RepID=UPI0007012E99|nr:MULTISPECIES: hypothetical protein [unclassified Methylophilus]KQT42610.1 hypothetical protein ASG34_07745 [Methylophilus sp. Leaf416]KQT56795.1 hypothetical protein ASG44_07720 [Methylophilus sp. Leaf459]
MKILLSIKPEFALKILNGDKKFEFRKSAFANVGATCVVIYATKPLGMIIGEFDVSEVFIDAPENIWERTKKFAGIGKVKFDEYYLGRETAVALVVGEVRKYDVPLELGDLGEKITPPQSFRYLNESFQHAQLQLI